MAFGAVEGLVADCLDIACPADPAAFCPDRPATKAELASFTVQAFDVGRDYGCAETEEADQDLAEEDMEADFPENLADGGPDTAEPRPDADGGDPQEAMEGGCACMLGPA
jgi:hypothetical protein